MIRQYLLLIIFLHLLFAAACPAATEKVYNVQVNGNNHLFRGQPASRQVQDNTTIKVSTRGETITLEVGQIGSVHNAAIYKGKLSRNNGEFSAIWWYQGAPWETRVVYGSLRNNKIKGTLLYPRVADQPVPGYLSLHFSGQKQIALQAVPVTPLAPVQAVPQTVKEDCISFNPDRITVKNIKGRWKIVEGSHYILDFGNNKNEAVKSLKIMRHYRLNQSCFVGRPNPSLVYWLHDRQSPAGSIAGEDCLPFKPQQLKVKKIKNRWKIVEGGHWLLDFGASEKEARQAYRVLKKYGFRQHCFVGRPQPSFEYWRK